MIDSKSRNAIDKALFKNRQLLPDPNLIQAAKEYWVAIKLARLGWLLAIAGWLVSTWLAFVPCG